jgi:hypothetical protein
LVQLFKNRRQRIGSAAPLVLAIVIGVTGAGMGSVSASEVVSPEECTVRPITENDLVAIVENGTPTAAVTATVEATGELVDDETAEVITKLVRQSIACTNANDPMRAFALFTDRYLLARFGGDYQDDLGHLLAALTREPDVASETDRLSLDSVATLTALADGRMSAIVTTSNSSATFVDTLIFAQVEDVWLIDDVILGPTESTPAPAS